MKLKCLICLPIIRVLLAIEAALAGARGVNSVFDIAWDRIFDTSLEFQYPAKEIDIDDEQSGQALDLSPGQRHLLRRTGNVYRLNLDYR
jgi:hypothetical protein